MNRLLAFLDPYRWLIAGVMALSLFGGFMWYRHSLIQEGRDQVKAEVAKAVEEQKKKAEAVTRNLEEVKDEEIQKANERAKQNAAAAGRAKSELDRLRKQTGSSLDAAKTSDATCIKYAATATDVLNECGSALQEMATKADGHVSDIRTLTGSWPAWDKFALDLSSFQDKLKGTK